MQNKNRDPRNAGKPAYVLLILRDERIDNWSDLCRYFELDPARVRTFHGVLRHSIERLEKAGLVSVTKNREKITISDALAEIQTAIGFSVKELALREDHRDITVKPIFEKPRDHRYGADVFVLMPFSVNLQPVYDDHIKTVAEKLSLSAARADDFFTSQSIMQEIWEAIYFSTLIIADCTGRNPNVFYEIGLAHTLGKPVILITQDETDVPFDLRHRRYIKYEYTPRGMVIFEKQISGTLNTIMGLA